jgi:type VI secretion system protein ImpK
MDGRPRRSLQDLATGLFGLVISLRESGGGYGSEAELRQRILGTLGGLEREAAAAGYGRDDVEGLKFPLVAFIDEVILASNWEHRERWRDRPLQYELFGDRMAGARFFENLARIRRGGDAQRDLLEVYHLCLTLGFEGQYKVTGREALLPLVAEVRRELDTREVRLAPNGKRRDNPVGGLQARFPIWIVAGGAGLLLIVLYVILQISIHGAARAVL